MLLPTPVETPMRRMLVPLTVLVGLAAPAAEPDWLEQPTLTPAPKEAPAPAPTPAGPEARPAPVVKNLLANGDFERGARGNPTGWRSLDGLTARWTEGGPSGKGRCLLIDTDVYLREWKTHLKERAAGRPGITRKTPTRGPKYDTVAGMHGVHVYSDYVSVAPHEAYMLSVTMRGPTAENFYPKVFVKGYREVKGTLREVWRSPVHCRTRPDAWRTFTWKTPKVPGTYGVQKVRVVLYCYWPPGVYHVDDVVFSTVGKKATPVPRHVQPPRSPRSPKAPAESARSVAPDG
jgi:hypothetical protein